MLGKIITPDRYISIVLSLYRRNGFEDMNPEDFAVAAMRMAGLALDPEPTLGHVFLLPFWNERLARKMPTIVIGYQGAKELAYRSGRYANIFAEVVYRSEYDDPKIFDYERGSVNRIYHKRPFDFQPQKDDQIVGAYAVATDRENPERALGCVPIPMWQILERRESSASWRGNRNKSPWTTHFGPMCKKTGCLILTNELSQTATMRWAAAIDDADPMTIDIKGDPIPTGDGGDDTAPWDGGDSENGPGPEPLTASMFSDEEWHALEGWLASKYSVQGKTDFNRFLANWDADKQTLLDQAADWNGANRAPKPDDQDGKTWDEFEKGEGAPIDIEAEVIETETTKPKQRGLGLFGYQA